MTDLKRDLDALRIEREPERRGLGRWIIWTGLIIVLAALGFGGWRWIFNSRTRFARSASTASAFAGEPVSRTARSYSGPK